MASLKQVRRQDVFKFQDITIPSGQYKLNNATAEYSLIPSIKYAFSESDLVSVVNDNGNLCLNLPQSASYLTCGDIISVFGNSIRVTLSKRAETNTLLVTEQCNNLCSFCSQPPKSIDDSYLYKEATNALIEYDGVGQIGITGGEPTLLLEDFISLLSKPAAFSKTLDLHILTNGRSLSSIDICRRIAIASKDHKVLFGIPLYSHHPDIHDKLVGHNGAWQETIDGLINAIHAGLSIELRFIPTQQNADTLSGFAEFVSTYLYGIDQLSIMQLEPKGWARSNWDDLVVDPKNYLKIDILRRLKQQGINAVLFNYPLCSLPDSEFYEFSVKSISDWKNYYPEKCNQCSVKSSCGGFFSSAERKFLEQPRPIYEI